MSALRVRIDELECAATGFCTRIVPDVFRLNNPEGPVEVDPEAAALADPAALEEAALTCPTSAILLDGD